MKNLFKSLILLILEMLVQRKIWKGSWMPEWLNSDFEQGTGRKVERGQAIPLTYFKDANKELTIMQKLVWENPAHTAKAKFRVPTVSSLRPTPLGLLHNELPSSTSCWRGCCCWRCSSAARPPPGLPLPAGSSVTLVPRGASTSLLLFSSALARLSAELTPGLLYHCLLSVSPLLSSLPAKARLLSSLLAERVNSSTPPRCSLQTKTNTLILAHKLEFCWLAVSASQDSESRGSRGQQEGPVP